MLDILQGSFGLIQILLPLRKAHRQLVQIRRIAALCFQHLIDVRNTRSKLTEARLSGFSLARLLLTPFGHKLGHFFEHAAQTLFVEYAPDDGFQQPLIQFVGRDASGQMCLVILGRTAVVVPIAPVPALGALDLHAGSAFALQNPCEQALAERGSIAGIQGVPVQHGLNLVPQVLGHDSFMCLDDNPLLSGLYKPRPAVFPAEDGMTTNHLIAKQCRDGRGSPFAPPVGQAFGMQGEGDGPRAGAGGLQFKDAENGRRFDRVGFEALMLRMGLIRNIPEAERCHTTVPESLFGIAYHRAPSVARYLRALVFVDDFQKGIEEPSGISFHVHRHGDIDQLRAGFFKASFEQRRIVSVAGKAAAGPYDEIVRSAQLAVFDGGNELRPGLRGLPAFTLISEYPEDVRIELGCLPPRLIKLRRNGHIGIDLFLIRYAHIDDGGFASRCLSGH